MEVRELLSTYDFPGDDTPVIRGSALQALTVTLVSMVKNQFLHLLKRLTLTFQNQNVQSTKHS
jgi:elongation factor Tu